MTRSREIKHGEYTWHYEKADLDQGAYHIADPDRQKVAVIFPADRDRPIEDGHNARLLTRDFGTTEWRERGIYTLKGAMTKGNEHIDSYRVKDQAAHTLQQIRKEGLTKDERAAIENLRSRDGPQPEKARDDTLAAKAWRHIREARQRREEEKIRGRDRDGGRER